MSDLSTHLAALKKINAENSDESTRIQIEDALQQTALSIHNPWDTLLRLFNLPLEVPMLKTGADLGVFKMLAASETPMTLAEVSKTTGAEPDLLRRVLRYLAGTGYIAEAGRDEFTANTMTKYLARPDLEGSINYIFEMATPAYQILPEYLKRSKYHTAPLGSNAWKASVNTEMDFFPYYGQTPEKLHWFQGMMSVPRSGDWFDVMTLEGEESKVPADRALFVDVGGSFGHQSRRLKAKVPSYAGRIIVQDLPATIAQTTPEDGIQFMEHDFFTPQPVKGARFYYFRTIMHDWPDEQAAQILKHIADAMGPGSQILIDDMVLPNQGVHWWAACLDMHMNIMLNARERTVDQWNVLFAAAGLKIVDIKVYAPALTTAVIVVEKA